jgi:hypothetical protein
VRTIAIILTILVCSVSAQCQTVVINGIAADSATMKPLAYVNLQIKNYLRGTFTNEKGYFSLSLSEADTVIFSMVGYQSRAVPVKTILNSPVVYLREINRMLREITVSPFEQVRLPDIPKTKILTMPDFQKDYSSRSSPMLQPFGPTISILGIISRFTKYEKERKKLPKVRDENKLAGTFISLVSDSSFIKEFTTIYNISLEEYQRVLQTFNENYRTSIYKLPKDELISLLHIFYAESKKNGRTK